MKILIIEDDHGQAETLAKLLLAQRRKQKDLDIACADTLTAGFEKAARVRPDVTLLDPGLPDVANWKESLKAIPNLPPTVVVVTGLPDENYELTREAYAAGAEDVFHKPFCTTLTDRLLSALTSAVLRHRARTDRLKANEGV